MLELLHARFRNGIFIVLRTVFRLVPLSEATRDHLRQGFVDHFPGLVPDAPLAQAPSSVRFDRIGRALLRTDTPAIGHVPHLRQTLPTDLPATLVAFYLPQFHPIPENSAWWGEGFTEWRNVARALPQFEGHAQPRQPADLGFYDLRNVDVLRRQAALAKEYGIGAFCFYFYWFSGKTLLETPLRNWLHNPDIDLPLCLCWANEKWTRTWDGRGDQVLIDQSHSVEDDLAFIRHVADYLRDPRYLRVEGRPLLLLYRPGLLPNIRATAQRWRDWCRDNGVGEIHLAYVQSFERPDPRDIGFDSAIEFPPNLSTAPDITAEQHLLNPAFRGQVLDWREMADAMRTRPLPAYPLFPAVNCGWDNEPRRPGRGRVYLHAAPRRYRDWLRDTIRTRLVGTDKRRRLVFINAWNEWAEGAVLEPDMRLGHAWLQATRQALLAAADSEGGVPDPRPCAVMHAWYPELLDEIVPPLRASGIDWRLVVTTAHERADAVRARLARLGINAEVEVSENRGRDILPFLRVANRLLDEGTDVVLKLHTKRSTHRQDGDTWRRELLDALIAPTRSPRLLAAFHDDASLGLIGPEGHVHPLDYFWGTNAANVDYLATRLELGRIDGQHDCFVAGSMYWIRLKALRPLLDAHLDEWEFEAEDGQVDGTMAHAIERIVAIAASRAGYRVETAAALCGEPLSAPETYPYAKRN
ncbi:MAG: glycoside hydrolase family 99-like domain-containing protein [Pseudoxanthomonas sp.]